MISQICWFFLNVEADFTDVVIRGNGETVPIEGGVVVEIDADKSAVSDGNL